MYEKKTLLLCRKIPTSYHNKAFGRRFYTYTPASVGVFVGIGNSDKGHYDKDV